MQHKGILVEIEGVSQAMANSSLLTPTASQNLREVVTMLTPGLVSSVSPDTGVSQLGGATLQLSDFSFAMRHLKEVGTTSLDGALNDSATTVVVDSTADFDSSGVVWIGREAIAYDTKTATQFQNCTRGYYRTTAASHLSGVAAYADNPFVLGRQVWVYWQDYADSANNTLRWTGYVEAIDQDMGAEDGTVSLTFVSAQKLINDAKIAATNFGKGRLKSSINPSGVVELYVELSNKENSFSEYSTALKQRPFVRIDQELVQVRSVNADGYFFQEVNGSPSVAYEAVVKQPSRLEIGDTVDFEDSAGNLILEGVTILHIRRSYPSGGLDTVTHNGDTTSLNASDKLVNRYKQRLTVEQRGMFGTTSQKHDEGADVQEIRVLQGDQSDLLFSFLFSKDGEQTQGPSSGRWDTLPTGWGLALDSSLVDIQSFQEIKGRSTYRRYLQTAPLDLMGFLAHFAATCNCVFVWQTDGSLKCKRRGDLYPLAITKSVNNTNLVITHNGQAPTLSLDSTRIANLAIIRANYNVDGQNLYTETVLDTESIKFYGDRELPGMDDEGILYVGGVGELTAHLEAILTERKTPYPIVSVSVLMDLDNEFEPGDLVKLTIEHLPDMEGSAGYSSSDTFEVVEVNPNPATAQVGLTLLLRRSVPDLGRVAPAAIVNSIASLDVSLESNANSSLAPTSGNVSMLPESGEDGTEPSHYFLADDKVLFVDASTLSSATPTTAQATVTGMNHGAATMSVDTVPGWLAAGDYVVLDAYDTTKAGANADARLDRYIWIADSGETLGSSSDDPYRWGR